MEAKNADLNALKINRSSGENKTGSSKKLFFGLITAFIVIFFLVVIFFLWNSIFSDAVEVNLTTASMMSPSQSSASLTASGYVVAQRKASVASKGTGRLVYLGVVEGDKVKKNQIIARLEDNDIKAQLEQALANLKVNEAELKDAENNFGRQKKLLESGSTTRVEFDAAESRHLRILASIDVAKALVHAAEVQLENTIIRAPFDGTVLTKNADVGEIVAPLAASTSSRAAVVTIADMSSLQIEADVSESNIERIILNQDCEIILDAYPGQSYPAYVAKIVPTADRSKATVMVKVGFKNYDERVLPEMSAKVLFLTSPVDETSVQNKRLLVLPQASIVKKNEKLYVYKVVDEKAVEVEIKTGMQMGDYIEITSGIQEGESVIDNVSDKIKDGTKVKIL
jgi:RND family efflux transporter MFP subunit